MSLSRERIMEVVRKEFIQTLRDRKMRFFLIVPPVVQLIMFGYVVTMDVKNVSTAWMDSDRTAVSRALEQKLVASGYFTITQRPQSIEQMQGLMDRGLVTIGINIDADFSKDMEHGKPARVQLIADGTDSNTATIAMNYAARIMEDFAQDYQAERVWLRPSLSAASKGSRELSVRAWYNPELKSRNFFIPGVIASIIMVSGLMLTSMAMVKEREAGTMEQLMVTPISSLELIIGKTLPFAVIGFFDMLLVTVIGVLWFAVPIKGSLIFLFLCTTLYLFSILGAGLFISTISRTQQQALMATSFFYMPGLLLSGFIFPIENMPEVFQWVTYANPLRYYLVIIRGVFLKGSGFALLWQQIAALFAMGVLIILISTGRLTKRSD